MTRGITLKQQRSDLRRKRAQAAAGHALGAKAPANRPRQGRLWAALSRCQRRITRPSAWLLASVRARGLSHERSSPPRWPGRERPWRGRVYLNGRVVHLGYFGTEQEAKAAHADAVKEHLGDRFLKTEDRPA
jgi:hypothetical protein